MSTKFGIITSIDQLQAGITVNSLDTDETVQTAEARNETGAITDITAFSNRKNVSIQGVMTGNTADLATAGSIITLGGVDWLITNVTRAESNTDYVQVTISATTADDAEIRVINGGGSSSSSSSSPEESSSSSSQG